MKSHSPSWGLAFPETAGNAEPQLGKGKKLRLPNLGAPSPAPGQLGAAIRHDFGCGVSLNPFAFAGWPGYRSRPCEATVALLLPSCPLALSDAPTPNRNFPAIHHD
jgi:hypothetical protein